jgi:hypothetical protein
MVGSTHLVGAMSGALAHAIAVFRTINHGNASHLYLNHCGGESAFLALAKCLVKK